MKNIIIILCCCLIVVSVASIFSATIDFIDGANNNDNAVHFSQLTYVALGDSITYGVDGVNGGRMTNPYPSLVQNELNLYKVSNYGIKGSTIATGGDCYAPMSVRYAEMDDADIVSVLGGVNDFFRNVPLGKIDDKSNTTVYGSLNVLCKSLIEKYPNAFIFFMTPFKAVNTTYNSVGYTVEHVANAVKQVCALYNIPVLDLYNLGSFEIEAKTSASDKVHPSQQFVEQYTAPQIVRFIRDNYNK